MKCPQCGAINAAASNFCLHCGHALWQTRPVYARLDSRAKTRHNLLILAASILGLAVGGVLFYVAVHSKAQTVAIATPPPQTAPAAPVTPAPEPPPVVEKTEKPERRIAKHTKPAISASAQSAGNATAAAPTPAVQPAPSLVPPPAQTSTETPATPPVHHRRAVQESDAEGSPLPIGSIDNGGTAPPPSGQTRSTFSSPQEPVLHRRDSSTAATSSDEGDDGRPILRRRDTSGSSAPPQPVAVPSSSAPSAQPAYNGPMTGVAIWTGKLDKDGTLAITGGTASIGNVQGAPLPSAPIRFTIDQKDLGIAEWPSAANGYKLVLKSHSKHDKITIHWDVVQ